MNECRPSMLFVKGKESLMSGIGKFFCSSQWWILFIPACFENAISGLFSGWPNLFLCTVNIGDFVQ